MQVQVWLEKKTQFDYRYLVLKRRNELTAIVWSSDIKSRVAQDFIGETQVNLNRSINGSINLRGRHLSVSDALFVAKLMELMAARGRLNRAVKIDLTDNHTNGIEWWVCPYEWRKILNNKRNEFDYLSALYPAGHQLNLTKVLGRIFEAGPSEVWHSFKQSISEVEQWLSNEAGSEAEYYSALCVLHALTTIAQIPSYCGTHPDLDLDSESFRADVSHLIHFIVPERCGSYSDQVESLTRMVNLNTQGKVQFVLNMSTPLRMGMDVAVGSLQSRTQNAAPVADKFTQNVIGISGDAMVHTTPSDMLWGLFDEPEAVRESDMLWTIFDENETACTATGQTQMPAWAVKRAFLGSDDWPSVHGLRGQMKGFWPWKRANQGDEDPFGSCDY